MDAIIPKAIDDYCAAHSAPPSALRQELADYTLRHCAQPQMLVGALEAALLQMLVRVSGTRRVLEIGTFTGYSALALAEALPEDGCIVSCEINPEHARIAQSFFDRSPHGRKIRLALGPALDTLRQLPAEERYDFVFLDADKENYLNYYEAVLPHLECGGLIAADNVLWSGRVLDLEKTADAVQGRTSVAGDRMSGATHAIVRFNERVSTDGRVACVMLPLRDGVSLIRKR